LKCIFFLFRNRSDAFKTDLIQKFKQEILPNFAENKLKVIIDRKIDINWDDNAAEKLVFFFWLY